MRDRLDEPSVLVTIAALTPIFASLMASLSPSRVAGGRGVADVDGRRQAAAAHLDRNGAGKGIADVLNRIQGSGQVISAAVPPVAVGARDAR